jgi:hypothetical protein
MAITGTEGSVSDGGTNNDNIILNLKFDNGLYGWSRSEGDSGERHVLRGSRPTRWTASCS